MLVAFFGIDALPGIAGQIYTFSFEKFVERGFLTHLFRPLSLEVHQLLEGIVP